MAILDQVFGSMNWQRHHEFKEGRLYCTVSIYDAATQQWVDKEDVGTESNTEAEKGQASDSFKRACVNWGIGRELYTAPKIRVYALDGEKIQYTAFSVKEIEYKNGNISKVIIIDDRGRQRFPATRQTTQTQTQTQQIKPNTAAAKPIIPNDMAGMAKMRQEVVNFLNSLDDASCQQWVDYFGIANIDTMSDEEVIKVWNYKKQNQPKK